MMGGNGGDIEEKGVPVSKGFDDLPDDVEKKDQGADPELLTNEEKAAMVTALRAEYKLCEILPVVGMAKSSYEYARNAQAEGETEKRAAARKAVIEAFKASGGTYGYRRITAMVDVGEWTVRDIMRDEGLAARSAKKRRRYSSYEGEITEAPENLLRDERGRHHFHAGEPNELWITDVTEFRIPAGKVYLSPIVDCFDGMPLSWSISTSPDAEMANSSARASGSARATIPRSTRTAAAITAGRDG